MNFENRTIFISFKKGIRCNYNNIIDIFNKIDIILYYYKSIIQFIIVSESKLIYSKLSC